MLRVQKNIFEKDKFLKEVYIFSSFSEIEQKLIGLFSKNFPQNVETAFYVSKKQFWER